MRIHQKRFLIFFIILLVLSILALVYYFKQYQYPRDIFSLVQAVKAEELREEYIDDFQVAVTINKDSSVNVLETIVYNFGDWQKHGIYRDIPYRYFARGGKFTVGFKVWGVTDEKNQKLNYEVLRQSGQVRIKIGQPDVLVSGRQTYKINYSLNRVINFFNDHDELYWNVTGNNWPVSIDRSGIIVKLPPGIAAASLQAKCFTGQLDSSQSDCQVTNLTNSQVGYSSFSILAPEEGLTVVLSWPKGFLTPPSIFTQISWILKDNPLLLLPLLSLLGMVLLWYFHGRDLGRKRAIIPIYQPPDNLTPAEVGSLIDERVNARDLSSTFVDLAVRGYLKIKKLDNQGWQLIKLKDFNDLKEWEKEFAAEVFADSQSVKISDLKNKFYKQLSQLKRGLYQELLKKGFFPQSPRRVRNTYILVAMILLILGAAVLPFFQGGFNVAAMIISAVIIFWLGQFMPYKTKEGTKVYQEIKGYKMYLEVAEKDRIKFHHAQKKTPEVFEKNLPYAMVLKVEKKWAKQFEDIYVHQPSWYEGDFLAFNTAVFVSALNSFDSQSRTTLVTHPASAASGGSGF